MSTDPAAYERLREIAAQLPYVPGMGKVEIANGSLLVTTSPVNRHELAVVRIAQQLNSQLPRTHPGYVAHPGADLEDFGLGQLRNPDLMVFPDSALESDQPALLPHQVLLVLEVVSKPNPATDYQHKAHDYAAMGIPHYLLVDPRDGTGIIHSTPHYASREKFVFGDTIAVGPWSIDTSVLRTYA